MSNPQKSIRTSALSARKNLQSDERRIASNVIAEKVCQLDEFSNAKRIGCYLSMKSEVDTSTILARAWEENLRIFVPVVRENFKMEFRNFAGDTRTEPNSLGIEEPVDSEIINSNELDIVITPLVAFDSDRNRVGMGGGYYDREFSYLANTDRHHKPLLLGIAYDCQKVEKIAPNPWDIRLFRIFTETADY
jgi:5-formyltetrahydrofolate cyclo-ligase